jgi:hypothetical protein
MSKPPPVTAPAPNLANLGTQNEEIPADHHLPTFTQVTDVEGSEKSPPFRPVGTALSSIESRGGQLVSGTSSNRTRSAVATF